MRASFPDAHSADEANDLGIEDAINGLNAASDVDDMQIAEESQEVRFSS